jgi:hypothetical protein
MIIIIIIVIIIIIAIITIIIIVNIIIIIIIIIRVGLSKLGVEIRGKYAGMRKNRCMILVMTLVLL